MARWGFLDDIAMDSSIRPLPLGLKCEPATINSTLLPTRPDLHNPIPQRLPKLRRPVLVPLHPLRVGIPITPAISTGLRRRVIYIPDLTTIGTGEETVVACPVLAIRAAEVRTSFRPAGGRKRIAGSIVGEEAERVVGRPAEGAGEGEEDFVLVVQGMGPFVHGRLREFPLFGWGGEEYAWAGGGGCEQFGDAVGLWAAHEAGVDVVVLVVDLDHGAVDGPIVANLAEVGVGIPRAGAANEDVRALVGEDGRAGSVVDVPAAGDCQLGYAGEGLCGWQGLTLPRGSASPAPRHCSSEKGLRRRRPVSFRRPSDLRVSLRASSGDPSTSWLRSIVSSRITVHGWW